MEVTDWRTSMVNAVDHTTGVDFRMGRNHIENKTLFEDMIEVEFEDAVNTHRVLSNNPELQDCTEIVVRPDRGTIQFKFLDKELRSQLSEVPLIQRILEEDVPVREKINIDYEIKDSCVYVVSPTIEPITLFPNLITSIWRLTGLYYHEGMYHQRFEQVDSTVSDYEEFRIGNIVKSVHVPCPDCGGCVSHAVSSQGDNEWAWICDSCNKEYGHGSWDEFEHLNGLEPRSSIKESIQDIGFRTVCG